MLNQNNEYMSGQQTPRQRNEDGDAKPTSQNQLIALNDIQINMLQ